MSPRVPSTPVPLDLEGTVRLGIKTLIAVLGAVILATVTLFGLWNTVVTKSDIKELLSDHSTRPDAHPDTTRTMQIVQTQLASTEVRTKRLEEKQSDTQASVEYIRERIDFLTEQTVRQVASQRGSMQGQGRQAGDRAVQRLRSSGDPAEAIAP